MSLDPWHAGRVWELTTSWSGTLGFDPRSQNPVIILVLYQESRVSCTIGACISKRTRKCKWAGLEAGSGQKGWFLGLHTRTTTTHWVSCRHRRHTKVTIITSLKQPPRDSPPTRIADVTRIIPVTLTRTWEPNKNVKISRSLQLQLERFEATRRPQGAFWWHNSPLSLEPSIGTSLRAGLHTRAIKSLKARIFNYSGTCFRHVTNMHAPFHI